MAWIVLIFAGIFEIVWAYSMKLSEGFTRIGPSIITLIFMILSFTLLAYAMRTLPLGNTYRDWETDRKSTRLNSSHSGESRMPSSA